MSGNEYRLNDEQYAQYQQEGIIRLMLPPAQRSLLGGFREECCIWLNRFGSINVDQEALAAKLPEIALKDRQLVAKLYKVSRRFPSVKRLASDPLLAGISATLMNTSFAACCHFINNRIDLPGEDKYLLPPHQDFPYIQDSPNSVTWWIPFDDTPIETGPPTVIPGTHKLGILKVKEFDYESTGRSGGKSFVIADESPFEGMSFAPTPPLKFGEAMVFNTLLLHRSEPNNSSIARINTQLRFSDPLIQESFDKNYPEGLYLGDSFSKSYPEYVV
jgi:ectoine hydroxylase-related dioxygenase (phytanoyl-CoA dioxygenase family)